VVEAIGHKSYPHVLGVQFHPESLNIWDADRTSRLTPEDKQEINLISALEKHPPSLAFHKKIWSWFSQKIKAAHQKRSGR
jgi:putative glutamine amidotransferase